MGFLSRAIASLRSAPSERSAPRRPSRGERLHAAFLANPSFEIGSATIYGSWASYREDASEYVNRMIEMETAWAMLERIDDARRAHADHVGPASLRPVKVSFSAMDWGHVRHLSDDRGDGGLNISMPFIVGGRWISNDVPALLDLASTIVVDMSMQKDRPEERARLMEVTAKVGPVMDGLYKADQDCGYHVNMPSPFGPAEIRRHDITSSPFEAFRLPDTETFQDLPSAYEADGRIHGPDMNLHVTRFRVFNGGHDVTRNDEWQLSRTLKSLVRFDPTPLPDGDPHPASRRELRLLRRGRTVLMVRYHGKDDFEFPGFVPPKWSAEGRSDDYDHRMETLLSSIGVELVGRDTWSHVATGTYIPEEVEASIVHHELRLLRFEGEPTTSGDVTEIHWMDVDAPDRPMTFVTEHLLLDRVRQWIDKGATE
jgi:hypothetical protein